MKLVYLSPVPWSSVAQRSHFFVKAALRCGFNSILWVEPTPSRFPKIRDLRTKFFSVEADSFDKPRAIEIIRLKCIPIEPLGYPFDFVNFSSIKKTLDLIANFSDKNETILVIGKPSRLALAVLEKISFHRTIFDVMDDFPHFFKGKSKSSMVKNNYAVIKRVDICIFSSHNLMNKYKNIALQSELIMNACDKEFKTACDITKNIKTREAKVFGYVGSIAEWFDWDMVIGLASNNPEHQIVLVGPNYSNNIPKLPGNIEIRMAIQHSEVPRLLSSFDFGLIPFKKNELTDSVDPIKYYEYIAAGLPVISTYFGEMAHRIDSGNAITQEQYQHGSHPIVEPPTFWEQRFNDFFDRIIHGK